jgi:hypothetical protein
MEKQIKTIAQVDKLLREATELLRQTWLEVVNEDEIEQDLSRVYDIILSSRRKMQKLKAKMIEASMKEKGV